MQIGGEDFGPPRSVADTRAPLSASEVEGGTIIPYARGEYLSAGAACSIVGDQMEVQVRVTGGMQVSTVGRLASLDAGFS